MDTHRILEHISWHNKKTAIFPLLLLIIGMQLQSAATGKMINPSDLLFNHTERNLGFFFFFIWAINDDDDAGTGRE